MGRIGRAVAAVTALILAGCQYELGTVPHAVDQPTATGRAVTDIVYHDGRLWVGYGDWGANTGPIEIVAYNLATRQWEHHATARTEAVHNLEVIDGTLWVLYTDPMSKGDVLRRKPDGTWQELSLGENGVEGRGGGLWAEKGPGGWPPPGPAPGHVLVTNLLLERWLRGTIRVAT